MEAASLSKVQYANLSGKQGQPIAYTFQEIVPPKADKTTETILIVFVNGLGLPQSFWRPTIDLLLQDIKSFNPGNEIADRAVSLFTYDRHGQGLSTSTATTSPTTTTTTLTSTPTPPTHDLLSSVQEVDDMITYIITNHLSISSYNSQVSSSFSSSSSSLPTILVVAHSIGVPLARLHSMHGKHTHAPTALLALDSNMANSDFISLMPDPDSPTFDPLVHLPPDTSTDQLRWTRSNYARMFHPSTPNPEGLDRSNLASLLPHAGSPALFGPDVDVNSSGGEERNQPVLLTVVGHDPETFADESLKISTRGLTDWYLQPAWERYNQALLDLGDTGDNYGDKDDKIGVVIIAKDSGHFVQRDNPRCVADEILKLLRRIVRIRRGREGKIQGDDGKS